MAQPDSRTQKEEGMNKTLLLDMFRVRRKPQAIPTDDPLALKHWTHETTGVLQPVIQRYLRGETLDSNQLAIFRTYLRQWIFSPFWDQDLDGVQLKLNQLRRGVSSIDDMPRLHKWMEEAVILGMNPL